MESSEYKNEQRSWNREDTIREIIKEWVLISHLLNIHNFIFV